MKNLFLCATGTVEETDEEDDDNLAALAQAALAPLAAKMDDIRDSTAQLATAHVGMLALAKEILKKKQEKDEKKEEN